MTRPDRTVHRAPRLSEVKGALGDLVPSKSENRLTGRKVLYPKTGRGREGYRPSAFRPIICRTNKFLIGIFRTITHDRASVTMIFAVNCSSN